MKQRESRLSRNIQQALRAEGWFCFKIHGSEAMMAGLPDIIVCAEGLFIGIETKMPESRDNVSPRQKYVHDKICAAGGEAIVVCGVQEAVMAVHEILERAQG
jgi:Holliday junction resolvase